MVTDEIDVENNRATVSYNLDYFSSQVVMGSGVAKIRFGLGLSTVSRVQVTKMWVFSPGFEVFGF